MVYRVKQLLDDHGIPSFIKNEFASGAIGELSPLDVMPEVWLTDDEWSDKAKQLIANMDDEPAASAAWQCPLCKEVNEANFALCWNCGASVC